MARLVVASLWARKRRLAGTGVAVLLGVAFLVGTLVLGDTIAANFDRLFTQTSAGTDVVVRSATSVSDEPGPDAGRGSISADLLATVRGVAGVQTAEGSVSGYGQLLGADGEPLGGNGPPRVAGSWVRTPPLNAYRLVAGRAPAASDEVVINRGAAEAGDLHVGDRTIVQTPGPTEVRIVGIATFGGADGLGQTTFAAFTLRGAQEHVLGTTDALSTIRVEAAPGVAAEELAARIGRALPDGVQAITGAQLTQEQLDSLTFLPMIRTFLVVFAAIALVVAMVSINNTFGITVSQRSRELSLLRAVGASRRQVRRLVTLEALLVGAASTVLGVGAGLGVAGALKGLFDTLGFALPAGGLKVGAVSVLVGLLVGVLVTMLAARASIRRASARTPLAGLRDAGDGGGVSRRRVAVGAAVLVLGLAGVVAGAGGAVALVGVGGVLTLAGALLLAPVGAGPFTRALGALLARVRGLPGRLARDNALRHPRRTAATATSLLVGVAVVVLFTVFAASMSASLDGRVRGGFGRADLAVSTPSFGGGRLSPELTDAVQRLGEVDEAVALGTGPVALDGDDTTVTYGPLRRLGDVLEVELTAGGLADAGADTIAVSATHARDHHQQVGSTVRGTFLDGTTRTLTVGAVYDDNQLLGGVVVPAALWQRHVPQPSYRAVFLTTADGVSVAEARAALDPLTERYGGDIQDRAQFASAATGGLDLLLSVVYALLALAIVIALLGIANALSLAVHERRREIGLLRAVGQSRAHGRAMVRLEAVIIAAFGTLCGLAVGVVVGWGLFSAVADTGAVTVPVARLAEIAGFGVLAGALAGIRPARRAARQPVLAAIEAR